MTAAANLIKNHRICEMCVHHGLTTNFAEYSEEHEKGYKIPYKISEELDKGFDEKFLCCENRASDHYGHILLRSHPACAHIGFGS